MKIEDVVPPGEHRHDPCKKELDPVTWALARALTHLTWIGEHWHGFQARRDDRPDDAEEELRDLIDSQRQAMNHLERLAGLLLAGYTRDPAKRVHKDLQSHFERLDSFDQTLKPKEKASESNGA